MSKTLIVGDLHIGKGLSIGKPGIGNSYNSRIIDQLNILNWIIDITDERNVERIVLTGDIFEDLKPPYYQSKLFIDWLKRIESSGVDVHIIIGNHDITRSGSTIISPVLDLVNSCEFSHVHIYYNIETIETEDVSYTFIPFRDRRSLQCETHDQALKIIKDCLDFEASAISKTKKKVIVGHLALEGAIYVGDECDDSLNELICPLNMFVDYDYTWMGHVHRPQVKSQIPFMAHTGSLDLSDFGETDHIKNLILIDPHSEDFFENIPIPSRPLRRLRVNISNKEINSTDYVIEIISGQNEATTYKNALVKIEITLCSEEIENIDTDRLSAFIYSLGAYYITGITQARQISVISIEQKDVVDNTIDPKSAVKLYSKYIFNDDDINVDKSEFIQLCNSIIDECKEKTRETN